MDEGIATAQLLQQWIRPKSAKQVEVEMLTDCRSLVDSMQQISPSATEKNVGTRFVEHQRKHRAARTENHMDRYEIAGCRSIDEKNGHHEHDDCFDERHLRTHL